MIRLRRGGNTSRTGDRLARRPTHPTAPVNKSGAVDKGKPAMPRLKNSDLFEIAVALRPLITDALRQKGYVTDDEIRTLAKAHSKHAISSDRSVGLVQQYLTEV